MKNIIFITLDCARYECFPFKGYTPNIDELAKRSTVYTNLYTAAPYTSASHATFLTGLLPFHHGVRRMYDCKISEKIITIAERLRDNGYKTAAFSGYTGLLRQCGLDRGFDYFSDDTNLENNFGMKARGMAWGNDFRKDFIKWHQMNEDSEPHFIFWHYFLSHAGSEKVIPNTYHIQGDYKLTGDPEVDDYYQYYYGKITYFDQEWLPILLKRYPLENSIYIITSDHGDGWDKNREIGHRRHLLPETTHIPCIVSDCGVTHYNNTLTQSSEILPKVINKHAGCDIVGYDYADKYAYFETNHDDIPGYRIGLTDGSKTVCAETKDFEEIKFVSDWYDEDAALQNALTDMLYEIKSEPNDVKHSEEHKRRLGALGYI
jgi:arylsulfatase A-like enzyme